MKNLFLIKNTIILFSYGKDSFYSMYKFFYKKLKLLYINYNLKKNYFFFNIDIINIIFFEINELIYRKIKFSILKLYKNKIFITNHHFLDNLEKNLMKFIKKKKLKNKNDNWFFKCKYFIKPLIYYFLKNYKNNFIDKTNKNIKINRNFIRCLISKFIK